MSGPWYTHVAVGTGEAVHVNVGAGRAVFVAVAVASGGGGVGVVIGAANNPPPVHASSRIAIPQIPMILFFILVIEFPDDPQTVEREPGADDVDDFCFFGDNFCQPACGDDFHIASQFGPESCHHSLDHAHIPKQ